MTNKEEKIKRDYRLDIHIQCNHGKALDAYKNKTGIPKNRIVENALNKYFTLLEANLQAEKNGNISLF